MFNIDMFNIVNSDLNRPWGGFYCISQKDIDKFINMYFPNVVIINKKLPLLSIRKNP